jgi:hypothetical protein
MAIALLVMSTAIAQAATHYEYHYPQSESTTLTLRCPHCGNVIRMPYAARVYDSRGKYLTTFFYKYVPLVMPENPYNVQPLYPPDRSRQTSDFRELPFQLEVGN